MRSRYLVAVFIILLAASTAQAQGGPPLLSDDPETPGRSNWEVYVGAEYSRQGDIGIYKAPEIEANYGPTDRTQIKIKIPWTTMSRQGHDTIDGLGNITLGLKWHFLDRDGFSMSVYPQFEANTPTNAADRGLVDLGSKFYLATEVMKEWQKLCLGAEVEYSHAQYGTDLVFYGVYLQYHPVEYLDLLAELASESPTGVVPEDWLYNFGFRYHFNDTYALIASAGGALGGAGNNAPDMIAYLGVQFDIDVKPNDKDRNEPKTPPPQAGLYDGFPRAGLGVSR